MLNKTFKSILLIASATVLASCGDSSYVQKESPVKGYKDYKDNSSAIIGVGEPVSKRQMRADATFRLKGDYPLEGMMSKLASTYNLAVRYAIGVRKNAVMGVVIESDTIADSLKQIFKLAWEGGESINKQIR